jgi:hypothetical protein
MIFPEPEKLKRKGSGSLEIKELNDGRMSYARTVLRWAPELADAVVSGAETLDKAYPVMGGAVSSPSSSSHNCANVAPDSRAANIAASNVSRRAASYCSARWCDNSLILRRNGRKAETPVIICLPRASTSRAQRFSAFRAKNHQK